MNRLTVFCCTAMMCTALFSSCDTEETMPAKGQHHMTIEAIAGEEVATRTTLDANGASVNWKTGDAISIFDTTGKNNLFILSSGDGTNSGIFDGTVSDPQMPWYAVFPYNDDATISNGAVAGIVMPATQKAVDGGFDATSNLMTAYSENKKFFFRQVVCYVKVTTETPCSKIVFKSNGSEKLAGTVNLTIGAEGIGTHNVTANGSGEVTLVPADGQTTIPAGTYHLGILPQSLYEGFTVECCTATGDMLSRKFNSKTDAFLRAKIVNLGIASVEKGWEFSHECQHYYEFGKGAKEYVDLGLPSGLLWATTNLGAMEPWEYGDYYAWAATEPWLISYDQEGYTASVSEWCQWKYTSGYCLGNAPLTNTGIVDYTPEVDAAVQQWGTPWHVPAFYQINELHDNTYSCWTSNYKGSGICGTIVYKVKSDADKGTYTDSDGATNKISTTVYDESDVHIFLPSAGLAIDKDIQYSGMRGYYGCSSLYAMYPSSAYYMIANRREYGIDLLWANRGYGYTVRPVYDPKQTGNIEDYERDQFNW